ncbi:MAG: radical SAM family heme chaperone HemW [Anaerolineae bacterium]|nr:radical SAM family heme chaperone HemW [Anaerolineae bacterium]
MPSIYLHIPFCHLRCNFCNLHTYGMGNYDALPTLRDDYTAALCREAELWAAEVGDRHVATVFFGGGTPTELSVAQLGAVLGALRRCFDISNDAEITVEGYPGLAREYLVGLQALGVNRVSFGVQSFDPTLLPLLDRQHTIDDVARTVQEAQSLGFSVALDFIYGLPGQTMAQWEATLDQALALSPNHLSLYALSIEEATRLRALIKAGVLPTPDADLAADMYRRAMVRLAEAGFEHYEISNWARPGHACRHNQVYWRNEPWLGLGAGAYGWRAGERYTNILAPTHYIEAVQAGHLPIGRREPIDRHTEMNETLMLGLRLRAGLDLTAFERRFSVRLVEARGPALAELVRWGLVSLARDTLRLTDQGLLVANDVLVRLLV